MVERCDVQGECIANNKATSNSLEHTQVSNGKPSLKRPERPLSAYKIFYKKDRPRVLLELSLDHVGFKELGKIISKRWRKANDEERHECEQLAGKALIRYRMEMKTYKKASRLQGKRRTETIPTDLSETREPMGSIDCFYFEISSEQKETSSPTPKPPACSSRGAVSLFDSEFYWTKVSSTHKEIPHSIGSAFLPPFDSNSAAPLGKQFSLPFNHFDQSPLGISWDVQLSIGTRLRRYLHNQG